jgi:DNA topoisomerase-3
LNSDKKDITTITDKVETLKKLKKGQVVKIEKLEIKESETTPPKRYNSGSIILAMESAGKLIEDDELREKIKGSGIGTSATRSGILNKLQQIDYISLNDKTQILTPTSLGESIYDIVNKSIPSLLKPELTASWEKGLGMIANGEIQSDEYMVKLEDYIRKNTYKVLKHSNNTNTNTEKKVISKQPLGKCIICNTGEIFENRKAYYCSNWKDKCEFTLWKDSLKPYIQEIDKEMIKELLLKGKVERSTATIVFKDIKNGSVELKNISPK